MHGYLANSVAVAVAEMESSSYRNKSPIDDRRVPGNIGKRIRYLRAANEYRDRVGNSTIGCTDCHTVFGRRDRTHRISRNGSPGWWALRRLQDEHGIALDRPPLMLALNKHNDLGAREHRQCYEDVNPVGPASPFD